MAAAVVLPRPAEIKGKNPHTEQIMLVKERRRVSQSKPVQRTLTL